jgi:outer membrane protein insertion porin family
MIGKLSFYMRAINSITDDDVRVSKRLYLPSRRLRGFESGRIGPVENDDFVGGNYASKKILKSVFSNSFRKFGNVADKFNEDA